MVLALEEGPGDLGYGVEVDYLRGGVGFAATLAWLVRGSETAGRPVEEIEEELKTARA
jgi:hypothetical protein